MESGRNATLSFQVTDADTAAAVGSGELPVLGTPRLLAWCEAATCAVLAGELPSGNTSVGTRVQLEHLAASLVGERIEVLATLTHVDGRLLRFEVVAHDSSDVLVGRAEVTRVVVEAERFLARLQR